MSKNPSRGTPNDRVDVTRTSLPPLEEYVGYLEQIWNNKWLTNQGPLLREFEEKTKEYLGVEDFQFVSNGTIAIQLALNALDITDGEIITTPFSYVATTSAILWERCTPIFVDIEPNTFCIDADKIEAAITDKTRAILAVHVFGFPCDVEKIEAIAQRHKLKVIYDAAHAFGVEYKGKSLLAYGDVSTCSFHATKLFHTIEGGCIVAKDEKVAAKIELTKRFGHDGDDHIRLGINAKASEFQAAMGLCNLKYIKRGIESRKSTSELYDKLLAKSVRIPMPRENTKRNYAYYPVLFNSEEVLLRVVEALKKENVFPRRYFYPSLNKLRYLNNQQDCVVSEKIANSILCLPMYVGLKDDDVERICKVIKSKVS